MQSFNYAGQGDSGNEDSTISGFPLTGRAARSIPHPLGWGGRTQFDLRYVRKMRPVDFPRLKRRDPLKQDFGLDNNLRRVEE